jgi:hypothetical protein
MLGERAAGVRGATTFTEQCCTGLDNLLYFFLSRRGKDRCGRSFAPN